MKKSEKSISAIKIKKNKSLFIEQLKRNPNIQIACEKLDIGRSTFYRWQSEDSEFKHMVDQATLEGVHIINDLAESKLVLAIKDGNIQAIRYWLTHHNKNYSPKLNIEHSVGSTGLTEEQKETIAQTLNILNTHEED